MKKILIMGLPGSGKTYFAERLKKYLEKHNILNSMPEPEWPMNQMEKLSYIHKSKVNWFNADDVRRKFNDWDFSKEGRIRQSLRMFEFAIKCTGDFVICDFVAPLPEMRNNFKADWTIWMDTIDAGRYEDTNKAFVPPDVYDFRINEMNAEKWVEFVGEHILYNRRRPTFDWKKETVEMLGRWQPWHSGHRALFDRAIAKTGQVCIMIRDCQGWNKSNPFEANQVKDFIKRDLDPVYQGQYEILLVPNITNITYGRDVGYKIEQEVFDVATHAISATNIRKELGLK
jgi:DNA polymerase III delta prime subunit